MFIKKSLNKTANPLLSISEKKDGYFLIFGTAEKLKDRIVSTICVK